MTETTYQQIEILTPTQDEPASCRLSTRNGAEQGKINMLNSHMSHRELQKSRLPAVPNHFEEKERKGTECWQSTHVTLNWLEQLKKWRWPFYKQGHANVTQPCPQAFACRPAMFKACFARPSPLASANMPSSRHMVSSGMPALVPTCGAESFPARRVIAICRRATAFWSHNAGQWMCRIFTAPRLEHNPLHAELSVTSSALTSSDKSDMRLFNPSVGQAHLTAP